MAEPLQVLTIGGSDSGGAAGVQADLRAWAALGVYGMSALTVVTAQNSLQVAGLITLPAAFVALQVRTVLTDYGAHAIKTGFIGDADLIRTLAECLAEYSGPVVIDPVLVNHRGQAMFPPAVAQAYSSQLWARATLITPNWREAELLTGRRLDSLSGLEEAADRLHQQGARRVLIKGWRPADRPETIIDVAYDGRQLHTFTADWIATGNTHGSGDVLSAVITAGLAQGLPWLTAVEQARAWTYRALAAAVDWRLGAGHGPVGWLT